ncbi:MAG: TonB-dependent receptor, partial [Gemmatimonadetes bacterium]|nr:TonB-dependent receptor [Gemmatimonadota bacterium]
DVLGKAEYRLNDNHLLSVHVLNAIDDLSAADDESGDHISSSYGNRYAWLRLRSTFSDQLASETVLSAGAVSQSRRAEDFERVWDAAGQYSPGWRKRFDLKETRDFDLLGLRQDWTWEATDRLMGFLGVDVKRLDSQAHYTSRERVISGLPINAGIVYDTTAVDTTPTGTTAALVGSVRWRAFEPLVVDAGLRYDHLSYTGDDVLGPRLSAVYSLGRRTFLRAAWGWFHQGQDINDLDVPFGETVYYPAQRAEHWVVGLEHAFDHAIDLRVEAYQKNLTSIRPRHENLSKDVLFAPELEEVSVFLEPESGTARGVEIFVKRDAGGRFSWWGSYALARAEEKLQGENVPKNQDQRHTIYVDCSWQPSRVWHLAMAWQYRSGWPYTERRFVRIDVPEGEWPYRDGFGPRNATLLPAYHRLDVRVNRYFELGKGRLSVFLEIINLYGRENVRDILPGDRRQVIDKELVATSTTNEEWFPLLPSIGASWEF